MFILDWKKVGPLLRKARLSKKMTLEQFYGGITEHVNNFSAIEKGTRTIGKRLAQDIIRHHHINVQWLEKGEDPVFLKEHTVNLISETRNEVEEQAFVEGYVPYYDVHLDNLEPGSKHVFKENPEYYINFRPFNDCQAYLPIYGDSMHPKFSNGEIIAVKEVMNYDIILWGEAYLIITNAKANSLATVKLLFEHPDTDKIILRAANAEFKGNITIEKADILKLYIVKGKITRNQL